MMATCHQPGARPRAPARVSVGQAWGERTASARGCARARRTLETAPRSRQSSPKAPGVRRAWRPCGPRRPSCLLALCFEAWHAEGAARRRRRRRGHGHRAARGGAQAAAERRGQPARSCNFPYAPRRSARVSLGRAHGQSASASRCAKPPAHLAAAPSAPRAASRAPAGRQDAVSCSPAHLATAPSALRAASKDSVGK